MFGHNSQSTTRKTLSLRHGQHRDKADLSLGKAEPPPQEVLDFRRAKSKELVFISQADGQAMAMTGAILAMRPYRGAGKPRHQPSDVYFLPHAMICVYLNGLLQPQPIHGGMWNAGLGTGTLCYLGGTFLRLGLDFRPALRLYPAPIQQE
ncbi:hypothetical protein BT67DRAFT_68639 [Trichocladium antarcticum]|uniref:Uncharacterized protein n=1 Tax=Trichocladium antarcticum TaxID=1450529 RepID=A0AAN6UHG9_9PEZI|nr:hypothetical protein BT67DRAFT_68639 [Trichocladium antarcticum]